MKYRLILGQAQDGRCEMNLLGTAGGLIKGSPNMGKSTLIEKILRELHKSLPSLDVSIISTSGKFDYDLGFEFTFFNPIFQKQEVLEFLRNQQNQMHQILLQMTEINSKDVTILTDYIPSIIVIDEAEAVESSFGDRKELEEFSTLVTNRINGGRKLHAWTVIATQSQTMDSLKIKTRSLNNIFLGRPQTKGICQSLGIDEKHYLDSGLEKGRLLWFDGNFWQIVKIEKDWA